MGCLYESGAWAYDAAFDWDVTAEVDWLLARMGSGVARILEPFCGAGRMFPAFARRGVVVIGVDLSEEMLGRARARMAREGFPPPRLVRADVTEFELGETCDGAISPVNSFAHLTQPRAAEAHLECVARHLGPRGRYLVQLDLRRVEEVQLGAPPEQGRWTADHHEGRIDARWWVRALDATGLLETHACRFEALDGPRAGAVVEDTHVLRRWEWSTFSELVEGSPFTQLSAYDGNHPERPELDLGPALDGRPLTWHLLEKRC